jgi:hypothetical protein
VWQSVLTWPDLTWLDRKWWGLAASYIGLVVSTWGIIWAVIEPLGIPETFETLPSLLKHRAFYHIVVTPLIASHLLLAIEIWKRRRWPPEIETSQSAWDRTARGFCDRVAGYWWERIHPDDASAISFLQIEPDQAVANTIRIKGRAFDLGGGLAAVWETVAACINSDQKKVFYYWKGSQRKKPTDPYEGFGEIIFFESRDAINTGSGFFSDTNLIDFKTTTKKSVEFRRSTDQEEVKVMHDIDNNQITSLVLNKLREKW